MLNPDKIRLRRNKPFRNEDLLYIKSSYKCCWLHYTDGYVEIIGHQLSNVLKRLPWLIVPSRSMAINPDYITKVNYYKKRKYNHVGYLTLRGNERFLITKYRIDDIKDKLALYEVLPATNTH